MVAKLFFALRLVRKTLTKSKDVFSEGVPGSWCAMVRGGDHSGCGDECGKDEWSKQRERSLHEEIRRSHGCLKWSDDADPAAACRYAPGDGR